MKKPSELAKIQPFSSAVQKLELEFLAKSIMDVLARTGDTFRLLSFEEYDKKCQSSFTDKQTFDRVAGYCVSAEKAAKFSKYWK
jgi:hypothetical protein